MEDGRLLLPPKRATLQIKFTLIFIFGFFCFKSSVAQVKIGTDPEQIQAASILELESQTKGLLLPRLTDTLRINTLNPADGMLIYLEKGPANGLYVRRNGRWNFSIGVTSNATDQNTTQAEFNPNTLNLGTIAGKVDPATQISALPGTVTGQVLSWNGSGWEAKTITQMSTVADAATLTGATLATNILSSSLTSLGTLSNLIVTNPIAGSLAGNAATATLAANATRLATARTINGVAFDGTSNIAIPAAAIANVPAGNLKATTVQAALNELDNNITAAANPEANMLGGTTLKSTILNSSLTTVGTLSGLSVIAPINGSVTGSATTVTTAAQPAITSVGTLTGLTVTAPIVGGVTGNAGTASKLETARTINGVLFDGTANINIFSAADANALTGTTLKSTIVNSSLTSVGTLANLTVTNPIAGSIIGNAATATSATTATTAGTVSTPAQPAITSLGTLSGLTVTAPITGSVTGNAGTATKLAATKNINGVAFDGSTDIIISAVTDAGTLSGAALATNVLSSSLTSVGTLTNLNVANPISGSITGNAATATSANKLATARMINGVPFDGTANIDITTVADANTLTGTTLKSTIVNSSLTSIGTLTNLTVTNPITGSITGNAETVTTNANLIGEVTSTGNSTSISNAAVIGKVLSGFVAGAGIVTASDNIVQALQKLDGNLAGKANQIDIAELTSGLTSKADASALTAAVNTIAAKADQSALTDGLALKANAADVTTSLALKVDATALTSGLALKADANALTAATDAIALKAPLASPTFTGTVSGVTSTMVGLGNVNNTSDSNKPVSIATQSALDLKGSAADLALKAPLASPTFTGTVSGVTSTMVGLGNVNNTSDANKPVSIATQSALDLKGSAADLALKAPLASPTFTGTVSGVTSTMVGLGNVNNTSDANKPVSTATQAALDLKASTADLASKAPLASPTFTGTVSGVTSTMVGLGNVNNTSDANKPVSIATQSALDLKGSAADLALKAPLASPTFTGTVSGVTSTMVGLGNVNNTSDANKPVSIATQSALDLKGSAADLALKAPLASPTFTGTVTATSVNKLAITAPTTSATLTIADGSTLATSGAFTTTLTSTAATNVILPTSGILVAALSGSATLDFMSTAAGTSSNLTISVPGAIVGDVVFVGVTTSSVPSNGNFFAWVSAPDTVTVRFINNSLLSALDPVSDVFKVKVFK